MRFPLRQQPVDGLPGVTGTARIDRRTSSLVRRLRPGDIAVICLLYTSPSPRDS